MRAWLLAAGLAGAAHAAGPAAAVPVTCDVLVLGPDELPAAGLTAADFDVTVGGRAVSGLRVTPAPPDLDVVLLLDLSISQPLKRYEAHTAILDHWLPSLNLDAGDRARVGVIGATTTFGPWIVRNRVGLWALRSLVDTAPTGPSPLWDAVDAATRLLRESPLRTPALVLVSDGRSTGNRIGLDEAIARALAARVAVNVVSEADQQEFYQSGGDVVRFRADEMLRRLAESTGGLYLEDGIARRLARPRTDPFNYARELIQLPNRPGPLLVRIMSALRQRYRVSFEHAGGAEAVAWDVRVRRPDAVVRAPRTCGIGAS